MIGQGKCKSVAVTVTPAGPLPRCVRGGEGVLKLTDKPKFAILPNHTKRKGIPMG